MHALYALPLALMASGGQEARGRLPTIGATAEVVMVDVIVTDKSGNPVTNLSREDFLVFDDAVPVELVAFRSPTSIASPGAGSAGLAPASPGAPLQDDRPTVAVYLENAALTPGGRQRIVDGVRAFVAHTTPWAFRFVVISDQPGEKVATAVGSSAEEIEAALTALSHTSAGGILAQSEERHTMDTMRDIVEMCEMSPGCGSCLEVLDQVLGVARAHAESRRLWLLRLVDKLSAVVGALGALPGRKALVYAAEAIEQRPGIQLFHQVGDICPQAMQKEYSKISAPMEEYDISAALHALAARANAGRVTLYPVDARGLPGPSTADASFGVRRYTPSARNDTVHEANLRAPLEILAQETGGTAIIGRNDPGAALAALPSDLAVRYDMGFSPSREPDGRTHVIKVRLRRGKGLSLRYRTSYLHAPPRSREVDRVLAALWYGLDDDTLGAVIAAEPHAAAPDGRRTVTIRVSVPLALLATELDGDGRSARLRLLLGLDASEAGDAGPTFREKTVSIRLPSATTESPEARHEFAIDVPLGKDQHTVAIGVNDALSSRACYRRLVVD